MGANRRRAKRLAQQCALVGCDMDFAADERENTDLIERALDAAERRGWEDAAAYVRDWGGERYDLLVSDIQRKAKALAKEKR